MSSLIQLDRKQVFGSEELSDSYLMKIKKIFDERISELTRINSEKSITMPLANWVR